MRRNLILLILILAIIGIFDSTYLAIEHYRDTIPPCSTNILVDCGQVLRSQYAKILGVPLALLGVFYYSLVTVLISSIIKAGKRLFKQILILVAFFGAKVVTSLGKTSGQTFKEIKKIKKTFNEAIEDDDDKNNKEQSK